MYSHYDMQPVIEAKLALEPECSLTELRAEKRVRYDKNGFNRPVHTTGSPSVSHDDAKLPSIFKSPSTYITHNADYNSKKGKGSPYSIAKRRVSELIPVLGSQAGGDASHKPGSWLTLLSARPAVTLATLHMKNKCSILKSHCLCCKFRTGNYYVVICSNLR